MKKKVLPLAVGAATAVTMSAAHAAMYVNENGLGENLIFPAYSVENGNNTLINIVNTTDGYKAVKVRMLEGQNSKEVLDFNLYLSPRDHFSFAISATADGGGMLTTGDNSCTVPAIPAEGVAFVNYEYVGDKAADDPATAANEGFDNTSVTRTAAGYIEVIEMGQLDGDTDAVPKIDYAGLATSPSSAITAAAAMKHDATGVPADCSILVDAWSTIANVKGQWLGEATNDTNTTKYGSEPKKIGHSEFLTAWDGGGLYGYGVIINVPQGAAIGYDAVAVDNAVTATDLANGSPLGAAMHYEPGDKQPNFSDTSFDDEALVISDATGASSALDFSGYGSGVAQLQALNATIMTTEIYNDYVTDPTIAATTDWVMTMPTKAFHLAAYSTATGSRSNVIEPFSATWTGQTACEPSRIDLVNREESAVYVPPTSDQPIFSPAPPVEPGTPSNGDVLLCYESTVLQFAETSAMGTSSLATGINALLDDADGWATLTLAQPAALDTVLNPCDGLVNGAYALTKTAECERKIIGSGTTYLDGLPIVGFSVQKYVNGAAGGTGVLANYGAAVEHKTYTKQS